MNLPDVPCPFCDHPVTRVINVRANKWDDRGLTVRRRRVCATCQQRFTTIGPAVMITQETVIASRINTTACS